LALLPVLVRGLVEVLVDVLVDVLVEAFGVSGLRTAPQGSVDTFGSGIFRSDSL
jgi:hypothetical protein